MRVMHEVTECQACPLEYDGRCDHPNSPDELHWFGALYEPENEGRIPPLCPLRKGELLITLRVS